jgi:hypothetical protein
MLCTICRHPQTSVVTSKPAHEAQELTKSASVLFQVKELIANCRLIAAKSTSARQWTPAVAALTKRGPQLA